MLHSMTITLIRVHQLETLYLRYGVKCKYGVIWGHWGQKVIFTKNAITRLFLLSFSQSASSSTCLIGF